jgi:hypothetical protein
MNGFSNNGLSLLCSQGHAWLYLFCICRCTAEIERMQTEE